MSLYIEIPPEFFREAREKCHPDVECPALLFGRGNAVETWRWVENKTASATQFAIDPEEMYRHLREAEERGLQLLAIFHTHPGPPIPSAADVRHMKLWRVVWVVTDVYSWQSTAWIWDNQPKPVEIKQRRQPEADDAPA